MRKRPFALFVCSMIFVYFPIEFGWRWSRGELLYWGDLFFSVVLPALLLYGLVRVNKFGWYTLIAFGALWGFKDLYELYSLQGDNFKMVAIHMALYAVSLSYFINPRIRPLYFDPSLRWWRIKKRSETHTPVIVRKSQEWSYPLMRNISIGGCFLETNRPYKLHDEIELEIPAPVPLAVPVIKTKAEVRWISDNDLRKGIGVQFTDYPAKHRKAVRQFVRKGL